MNSNCKIELTEWVKAGSSFIRYDKFVFPDKIIAIVKESDYTNSVSSKHDKYVGSVDIGYALYKDDAKYIHLNNFYYSNDIDELKILIDLELNKAGYITSLIGL